MPDALADAVVPAAQVGVGGPRTPQHQVTVGVAVQLIPLVVFPTVMTQDGPAHLDGAWVIASWGHSGPVGAVLHANYRLDLRPVPNMLSTFLLAGLLRLLPPDAAERRRGHSPAGAGERGRRLSPSG